MTAKSTSFRISEDAKRRLMARAEREGTSATTLLERLIVEGVEALDNPGIVYRGPVHDRRAGLAGGPDVWEVVARLRELKGSEEERIRVLAEETEIHPRLARIALEFAALHPGEIEERIGRNIAAAEVSRRSVEQRNALLG